MSRSKSGLFLMELIIAIAFFSFASAICIQLFATAHNLRQRSFDIQMAVMNAESAAEVFKITNGDINYMTDLVGTGFTGGNLFSAYCADWQPVSLTAKDVRYIMTIEIDRTVVPAMATIVVTDELMGTELHSLVVRRYIRD